MAKDMNENGVLVSLHEEIIHTSPENYFSPAMERPHYVEPLGEVGDYLKALYTVLNGRAKLHNQYVREHAQHVSDVIQRITEASGRVTFAGQLTFVMEGGLDRLLVDRMNELDRDILELRQSMCLLQHLYEIELRRQFPTKTGGRALPTLFSDWTVGHLPVEDPFPMH